MTASPLLRVHDRVDRDVEYAIPVDSVSYIIQDGGRSEILLRNGGSIKTLELFDYVVYYYNCLV